MHKRKSTLLCAMLLLCYLSLLSTFSFAMSPGPISDLDVIVIDNQACFSVNPDYPATIDYIRINDHQNNVFTFNRSNTSQSGQGRENCIVVDGFPLKTNQIYYASANDDPVYRTYPSAHVLEFCVLNKKGQLTPTYVIDKQCSTKTVNREQEQRNTRLLRYAYMLVFFALWIWVLYRRKKQQPKHNRP